MHHAKVIVVIVVLLMAGGLFLLGTDSRSASGAALPAASGSPSPSASPSASLAPVPAARSVVRRALKRRRAAVAAWREWNRARSAFSMRAAPFHRHSARTPNRAEPGARWLAAGRAWRLDRADYRERTGRLVSRMKHPGGTSSGARWLPLAKWLRWPSYALSQLATVIMRESSGRECADNGQGFVGLVQFAWEWAHGVYLIHGKPRFFNRSDATETLIAARDVWEDQHRSFLPAWSLTAW